MEIEHDLFKGFVRRSWGEKTMLDRWKDGRPDTEMDRFFLRFCSIFLQIIRLSLTLPIIFLQHKACRWSPQVPAWKTADLRGKSCLINSSHKWECFPCSDWYIPPCAYVATRDLCPSRVLRKFSHNLLERRFSLWSFSEDSLSLCVP